MDGLTKLDRIALAVWPALVGLIVGSIVWIVAVRGWLTADAGAYVVPVLGLALVLAHGLIAWMQGSRLRSARSLHE
jgi:hypothetical protein